MKAFYTILMIVSAVKEHFLTYLSLMAVKVHSCRSKVHSDVCWSYSGWLVFSSKLAFIIYPHPASLQCFLRLYVIYIFHILYEVVEVIKCFVIVCHQNVDEVFLFLHNLIPRNENTILSNYYEGRKQKNMSVCSDYT